MYGNSQTGAGYSPSRKRRQRCNTSRSQIRGRSTVRSLKYASRAVPEDDCRGEIVALATLNGRPLGVPLSQLRALRVPDEAAEVIADWHYWSSLGYRF